MSPFRRVVAFASLAALAGAADARADEARDIAFLNRLTWGATSQSLAELRREGENAWLEDQLSPGADAAPPPAAAQSLQAVAPDLEAQRKALSTISDPDAKAAAKRALDVQLETYERASEDRSVMRDLYSRHQLLEQMTWFWMNHFNVDMRKRDIRLMVGDYEERDIRPHALGRFRDLLEASLRHPAMMRYLDNDQNAVGRINENYARELLELHTMGVGSGYTQADVEALARILTGCGVNADPDGPRTPARYAGLVVRDGLFVFNPARHDFSDKVFLGRRIEGGGYAEVETALDMLARSPATARHLSREIGLYLLGAPPSEALVTQMAQTYARTDGDIAAVLRTLIRSPEFSRSLGHGFKDPAHYVISAVRVAYEAQPIANPRPVERWMRQLGEGLYTHATPDGYPMTPDAWNGPGQMAQRFEIARIIGSGPAGLMQSEDGPAVKRAGYPELRTALYYGGVAATLGPATRNGLDQADSPQDWNALFLSSPEFMSR